MQLRISIPPVTRVLLVLLIGLSSAYQIAWLTHSAAVGDYLALVPQWSVFCPWVFATATFTEQNIATLLIAAATIFGGGRYLERAWDSREFGKFVLITTVIPNTLSCFLYVLWFALTGDSDFACVASSFVGSEWNQSNRLPGGSEFRAPLRCRRPFLSPSSN